MARASLHSSNRSRWRLSPQLRRTKLGSRRIVPPHKNIHQSWFEFAKSNLSVDFTGALRMEIETSQMFHDRVHLAFSSDEFSAAWRINI